MRKSAHLHMFIFSSVQEKKSTEIKNYKQISARWNSKFVIRTCNAFLR